MKKTQKKILLVLCIAAFIITPIIAQYVVEHMIPNVGQIAQPGLDYYLDGEYRPLPINWSKTSPCKPGYTYFFENFTVVNVGNTALNVTIISYGLPSGWSFGWEHNNTQIAAGSKAMGELNLTIPADATAWLADCGFYLRGE